jgi:hypothetical protein
MAMRFEAVRADITTLADDALRAYEAALARLV